ncbi:hypothetical protein LshimejAT787_1302170 [Lyophyllum shimeji]|uniref:Uncharacterized protein n=1 Tax=Lyophyllum shimeji TaxID=47721 RepID=A0A9P3UUN1_LYOSH|nr:hypothetical protein LshimejAT787_1302170 [Lyophyllum shimeji]
MANTLLVPLSPLDHNGVIAVGATLGYVLKSVDAAAVEDAAKRVIDKWRLLAGRPEWSRRLASWCIRVPVAGDVSHRLKFSTSKLALPLDTPITYLGDTSAEILERPSLKFFRHPSVPNSLASYASSNHPIISIHIAELTNCSCLGISIPHGIFDAFGLGQFLGALDAELNGKPWTPPVFSSSNILRTALEDLAATGPHRNTDKPSALADVQRDFASATLKNNVSYGLGFASEYLWHTPVVKSIFLGKHVLEQLTRVVKDEAVKSGSGWVTTGDILMAWLLKAIYLHEHDDIPVSIMSVFSIRSVLSSIHPAFATYTHNAIMPCGIPVFTKEEITTKSMTELAIIHRRNVNVARNVSFIGAYGQWLASIGGNTIPRRRPGGNFWMVSNQSIGHFDQIDFGSGMIAQWFWSLPIFPDQVFTLNKFKGGYVVEINMRPERWKGVAETIDRMKKGENVKYRTKL